jgi:hypothetical protein
VPLPTIPPGPLSSTVEQPAFNRLMEVRFLQGVAPAPGFRFTECRTSSPSSRVGSPIPGVIPQGPALPRGTRAATRGAADLGQRPRAPQRDPGREGRVSVITVTCDLLMKLPLLGKDLDEYSPRRSRCSTATASARASRCDHSPCDRPGLMASPVVILAGGLATRSAGHHRLSPPVRWRASSASCEI